MTDQTVADDVLGKFARKQADLFERVRKGSLDPELAMQTMQNLIDKPQDQRFPFKINQNNHFELAFTGLNLTGAQEAKRLENDGFRISKYTRQILTSTNTDGYDSNHILTEPQEYKVALVPGCEIESNRTTANIQAYAKTFGYEIPRAGIMPRVRELISDDQMEEMKCWHIAGLHPPIKDFSGGLCMLSAARDDDGRWLNAPWGDPDDQWSDGAAFAFLSPAH